MAKQITFLRHILVLALAASASSSYALRDSVVDQAAASLRAKQAQAAFALLDPLEAERAGDVDFDLALGVAAHQTGHYSRAIMALERVVHNAPDNARAKAELASVYYAVRDNQRAKEMLLAAKTQGVPTDVAGALDQFMREIDRVDITQPVNRLHHRGYVSFGLGYDSNASSGPSDKLIPVPLLGSTIYMSPSVQSEKSPYYALSGGLSGRYTLSPEWSWAATADFSLNNNTKNAAQDFDRQTLLLATGPMWRKEQHELSLLANYSQQWQGGSQTAHSSGVVGSWVYRFDGFRQLSNYVQYSDIRYDNNAYANAHRTVLGSTYSHMARNGFFTFVGAYVGQESPQSNLPVLQHLGNDIYGLRAGAQYNFSDTLGA